MKEKMLKENGGTKVYVIIIVVLVILCAVLGAFCVYNVVTKDDESDDNNTSKKNETNTVQSENKTNKDKEDDDEDENETVTYEGDITDFMIEQTESLKGTEWMLSVTGDNEKLDGMVMTIKLKDYLEAIYEEAGGEDTGYTYEEYLEVVQTSLDESFESFGELMAEEIGVDSLDVETKVKWLEDETIEVTVDFSNVDLSEYTIDDDESVIETVVESFESQGATLKKVK